jgi:pilus assembly protein CpaE
LSHQPLLVTGSKGGVGTTTVALNLAVQLSMHVRKRVALLDLARPFGQISTMLDFEPRFTILDALERIDRLDEKLLPTLAMRHKSGVEILAGPLHTALKPEQRQSVTLEALTRLVQTACEAYEVTVVDMGVVNAAEWAPVLRIANKILLISEPSVLALNMIAKHLAAAGAAGIDCSRIEVIVNRWRQTDDEALVVFESNFRREILTRLPNDYRQVTEAVMLGMPLVGSANNTLIARYRELAAWVADGAQGPLERRFATAKLASKG